MLQAVKGQILLVLSKGYQIPRFQLDAIIKIWKIILKFKLERIAIFKNFTKKEVLLKISQIMNNRNIKGRIKET